MQSSKNTLSSFWQALFGDPIRAFGVVSLLTLISLAIAPAKNHFSEWRHYQKQYLTLIRGRGDAVTLQRHFHDGLQQIWLPELGVVDRCTTCHVGLKEASLADVSTQPFRRHPVIPHIVDQFGCVMCHRGQGAATTVEEAHRSTLAWEQPILPARYVESSCGQCHRASLAGTPQLNLGRNLLARYGCVNCHAVTATMPNFKLSDADARDISAFLIANSTPVPGDTLAAGAAQKTPPDPTAGASLYGESFCASCHAVQNAAGNIVGGDIGPDLTHIGNKVKPEWLRAWLRNPRVYDAETAMPHYRFNDQQISLLSAFLQNKADSDLLAKVHLDASTPEQIAHGKTLVVEYGCASCHEISGINKPENFAPELTHIGSKPVTQLVFLPGMSHALPDYISAKIRQPRAFGAALKMPQYSFTPAQVDALTTALLSLTDRTGSLPPALAVGASPPSNYRPAGKAGRLIDDLACFSCHTINGRGGDMAPDLTWEGSSVQRPWLKDFLKNPNTLRPALIRRMPKFNLSDSDIAELTDYIMTVYQNPDFDRDSMPLTGYPPAQVEQGKQLFYSKYACQSCHIVDTKTDKGYIGPTLTQVGSRLNSAWIYHWLKNPQALRPGTIEPNRNMSAEDARALTAFLMTQKSSARQEAKK